MLLDDIELEVKDEDDGLWDEVNLLIGVLSDP